MQSKSQVDTSDDMQTVTVPSVIPNPEALILPSPIDVTHHYKPAPLWMKLLFGFIVVAVIATVGIFIYAQFALVKATASGNYGAAGVLGAEALSGRF